MDPIDSRVGAKIRARRLELRLTQVEVACGLDVSFQQLQKYESGANRVSASRIYLLAQILRVRPDYFFDGGPPGANVPPSDPGPTSGRSDEGRRLNEAFQRIQSKPTRRSIIELIETIARDRDGLG